MAQSPTASRFSSPLFLVCGVVLLIAVLALPATMNAVAAHYTKLPAPIRLTLHEFDFNKMPSFRHVQRSTEFGIEDQDIGTDESFMVAMRKLDAMGDPIGREALFHAAYYDGSGESGLRVSHTPEVCYRQGGATIKDFRSIRIDLPPGVVPGHDSIPARLVDISLPGGAHLIDIYFFVSNGEFYHDRERLRFAMSMASEPRVYFLKVESGSMYDIERSPGRPFTSPEDAAALAISVLIEGLPVLLEHHVPLEEDLYAVD